MQFNPINNHRILVIDDNQYIHSDFRKILLKSSGLPNDLDEDEAILFEGVTTKFQWPIFEIDSAYQGQEGLDLIEKSLRENRPYALAFVDVRMPPGWDGVETTCKIWEKYPDLQVIICTAYSDYSWEELLRKLEYSDRMVILKKPFDNIEVLQLAMAMTEKWRLYQQAKLYLDDLEKMVLERTLALKAANIDLIAANSLLIAGTEKVTAALNERRLIERALYHKNIQLQTASETKSRFLANMSHELRTPLNGIIGFAEFLVDGKPGTVNAKQKEYLDDILNSGKHLLQLINDLLDLAKVEAGKMELNLERFSLRKAIEEACSIATPIAEKKTIRIDVNVSPKIGDVTLDKQKFKQILYNLLSNAIKFSDEAGLVEVFAATQGQQRFRLLVKDSGIGIKPEDIQRLFAEFTQLESDESHRHEGTGLGLALTRKIVELQGGKIEVESEIGKGSSFIVVLPLVGRKPIPESPPNLGDGTLSATGQ
jgi:two-component system sensor histidine kinase/response regulator